jgi:hypothetical protein
MIGDDWVTTTRYTDLRKEWKQARREGTTADDWATWSARALGPETVGELAAKQAAEYERRNQKAIAAQTKAQQRDLAAQRKAQETGVEHAMVGRDL